MKLNKYYILVKIFMNHIILKIYYTEKILKNSLK